MNPPAPAHAGALYRLFDGWGGAGNCDIMFAKSKKEGNGMIDFSLPDKFIDANVVNNLKQAMMNHDNVEWKFERIVEQIKAFQENLDDATETAIRFASFGQDIILDVDSLSYQNPDIIYFHGKVNGHSAQLIQHMSQLNFMLIAVPISEPEKPVKEIGFVYPTKDLP